METQISKPEDFHDKGFFHKHALLATLFFLLLIIGVGLAIYFALPDGTKCATFGTKCAQAPTTNNVQNSCLEGTKLEDCIDTVTEEEAPTPPPAEEDGLNTYTNTEYGFSFSYPDGVAVGKESPNSSLGEAEIEVPGIYVGHYVFVVADTAKLKADAKAYINPLVQISEEPIEESPEGPSVSCKITEIDNTNPITVVSCIGEGGPATYGLIDGPDFDVFVDGYSRGWDYENSNTLKFLSEPELIKILQTFQFSS